MYLRIILALAALLLAIPAEARTHHSHYKYSHRGGGSCDGIHRCRCGSTQTAHFGLPRNFNGHNLWRAVEWVRAFPRTTVHAGVVGYVNHGGPSGHVFRVVQPLGNGQAVVSDDKGTYTRNISNAIFVDPNGNLGVRGHGHARHAAHIQTAAATYY
jgi:hypothetical protein